MRSYKKEHLDTIINWFKECNSKNILPWEYDFKLRSLKENKEVEEHPIKRIFEWYLDTNNTLYANGETEKTDLAMSIYSVLWDINLYSVVLDADIMNSFWTTYKRAIEQSTGVPYNKWKEGGINTDAFNKLISRFNDKGYSEVNTLFKGFASKTQTLGNFTIEAKGFNKGRQGNDYWDYALSLMKQSEALGFNFRFYVDKFFMTDYLNEDYSIKKLWDKHDKLYSLPESITDIQEFLENVEINIEQRGICMVKALCKKVIEYNPEFESELDTYFFYGKIK